MSPICLWSDVNQCVLTVVGSRKRTEVEALMAMVAVVVAVAVAVVVEMIQKEMATLLCGFVKA